MKYNLFSIIIFIFALIGRMNASEFNVSGYSEGDSLHIANIAHYDICFYIFMDVNTGPSCYGDISSVKNYLKGSGLEIDFKLFLSGDYEAYDIEKFKQENNWDFDVVPDQMEIYKNYFKIKLTPSYLVIDKNGILLCEDKYFHDKCEIKEIILNTKKGKSEVVKNYKIKKKIQITDQGDTVLFNMYIPPVPLVSSDSEGALITTFDVDRNIHEIDSVGKVIKTSDIGIHFNENSEFWQVEKSWINPDSVYISLMFVDSKYKFFYFDRKNSKLEEMNLYNRILDSCLSVGLPVDVNYSYLVQKEVLFINSSYNEVYAPDLPISALLVYPNGRIKTIDFFDEIYDRFDLKTSYYMKSASDDSLFYGLQLYSKKILCIDSEGEIVNQINLTFDSTYRIPKTSSPKEYFTPEQNKFVSSISYIQNLFLTSEGNFAVLYENRTYPEGEEEIDFFSPKVKKQFYLHVSDRTGKNVLGRDIELPERFIAYKFEDDIIYGIQVDKQKLYLVELELEL